MAEEWFVIPAASDDLLNLLKNSLKQCRVVEVRHTSKVNVRLQILSAYA